MDLRRQEAGPVRGPDVRVHIERLVVTGVDVRDRAALGAAVEAEIARLFAERSWTESPQQSVS